MDIKVLRNFLKIAEYENITRAAAELHIAQPHLTRQLHALEQELGVTLFVREKKRLHITDEGRFLRQQAIHITDLADKTATQLLDMKSGHNLRTVGWLKVFAHGQILVLVAMVVLAVFKPF